MAACGSSHHLQATQTPHTDDHATYPDHGHHAVSLSGATAAVPSMTVPSGDVDKVGELGNFRCSACASCSVGTAIPGNVHLFVLPQLLSAQPDVPVIESATGFIQDALERPPRVVLA